MKTQITIVAVVTSMASAIAQAGVPNFAGRGRPLQNSTYAPNNYACVDQEKNQYLVDLKSDEITFHVVNAEFVNVLRTGKLENSPMGQLLTGYDTHIADAMIKHTLVLPNVLLGDSEPVVKFETILIESFQGTFFGPQGRFPGVGIKNEVKALTCTAQRLISVLDDAK